MDLSPFFKSVIEQDGNPVVICDTDHRIIYMNPAGAKAQAKHGGRALVGRSLLDCHSPESREKIKRVAEWFARSEENNIVHTFRDPKRNKDVYMVALRDEEKRLIGYYEKHEYRDPETGPRYKLD